MANEGPIKSLPQRPEPPAKAAPADPHEDPAAYLKAKGWRPLGNPEWESCLWLDPEKPVRDTYERRKIEAPTLIEEGYADAEGVRRKRYRSEMKPVKAQDGNGGNGTVEVEQVHFRPAVVPVGLTQAIHTQLERDAQEAEKARKAK